MDVVDAIAALPVFNAGGAATNLPLQNYTAQNAADNEPVTDDHLIRVTAIVVIDAAADTASGLMPAENTLIDAPADPPPVISGGGGGGGAFGLISLLALFVASIARTRSMQLRR